MTRRDRLLASTDGRRVDALIAGGGIHGAFAALECATRGYTVVLVDAGDFGARTSGNSMRILHGGFRYLRKRQLLRLRTSAREVRRIWSLAPGFVRALPCVLPATRGSLAQSIALRAAAIAFPPLTSGATPDVPELSVPPRIIGRDEITPLAGIFAPSDVDSALLWRDGFITQAERLIISILRSAEDLGAVILNHTQLSGMTHADGEHRATLTDRISGEELAVIPRAVIACAGPQTAALTSVLGGKHDAPPTIRACNAVVAHADLQQSAAVAISAPVLGRMLFAAPWNGCTILGTSERPGASLEEGECFTDIAHLISVCHDALPHLPDLDKSIVRIQRGLLPADPHSATPLEFSRTHTTRGPGDVPVIVSQAVKWTTARLTAAASVDALARARNDVVTANDTPHEALKGAEGRYDGKLPDGFDNRVLLSLAAAYGSRTAEIADIVKAHPELGQPLTHTSTVSRAQIVHAIRAEHAVHLDDILLRRLPVENPAGPDPDVITAASHVAAAELAWGDRRRSSEVERVSHELHFGSSAPPQS